MFNLHRRRSRRLGTLVGAISACALGAAFLAPAAGATNYEAVGAITFPEAFAFPIGMAVDGSSHTLFSGDYQHHLRKFDLTTEPPTESPLGEDATYYGVALDPSSGNLDALRVISNSESELEVFTEAGALVSSFQTVGFGSYLPQIAVDASGDVYVPTAEGNKVVEYDSAGNEVQTITCSSCPGTASFSTPSAVAIDSSGNIYVADFGNGRVVKFDSQGDAGTTPVIVHSGSSDMIAINPANDHLFVGGNDGSGYHVTEYDSAGNQVSDFGLGTITASVPFGGITVDATNGDVYVGDGAGLEPGESKIWHFVPVPAPTALTEAASGITGTTATLNATVNPKGQGTTECLFEWGTDTSYTGTPVSCSPDPGSDNADDPVSGEISGLSPNTTYHFRVVIETPGGRIEGADEEFTTLPPPPTVITGGSSGISQHAATIAGTVNPGGVLVTSCQFEYGTSTAYGSVAACPSAPGEGSSLVAESLGLSGLAANTTYHYRLVAANAGGEEKGADATFTTLADTCATNAALCPPPPKEEEHHEEPPRNEAAYKVCVKKAGKAYKKALKKAHSAKARKAAKSKERKAIKKCASRYL